MTYDLVKRLRSPEVFIDTGGMFSPVAHLAADRIEALENLFPAILEYLEQQSDVVDGDNGIPHPNAAMSLLVWTRHILEKEAK